MTNAATLETMRARIAELEAQVTKAKAPKPLTVKVSQKGAVSVYGLGGRFPVTLYRSQMERLLAEAEVISAFMEAHASELATKD